MRMNHLCDDLFPKRLSGWLESMIGTEGFLFSLISRLEQDFGLTTGSLAAVKLDSGLRTKAGDLLIPPKDNKVCPKYRILIA